MKRERSLVAGTAPHGAVAPKFEEADAKAMKAFAEGVANEGQQKRVLDWLLNKACGLSTWPYKESQRETDIALGRQMVGHQIVALIRVNLSSFGESRNG